MGVHDHQQRQHLEEDGNLLPESEGGQYLPCQEFKVSVLNQQIPTEEDGS